MKTKDTVDKSPVTRLLENNKIKETSKFKKKRIHKDIKPEHTIRCIISDKEGLKRINEKRDVVEDGLVTSAMTAIFRIYLYGKTSDGVIDIELPIGEDNSYGFLEAQEARIKKDPLGVYRLFPRKRERDIPKQFYPAIETNLLSPISSGGIIPYKNHVYGKGMIYKVGDFKTRTWEYRLEEVEIIFPLTYAKLKLGESIESLPDCYEKIEDDKYDKPDYQAIINAGENAKSEFKASARWDYKLNKINRELEKAIIKTIAGFLNTDGGILFIGVDDDGRILGLEKDIKTLSKKNQDGYRLFLANNISDKIGKEFNSYIDIIFKQIGGNTICIVDIKRSQKPAYVGERKDAMFFVRTQNSTRELNIREAYEYISSHFRED